MWLIKWYNKRKRIKQLQKSIDLYSSFLREYPAPEWMKDRARIELLERMKELKQLKGKS